MNFFQFPKLATAIVVTLLSAFLPPAVDAEEALYRSHFADEIHHLRGWKPHGNESGVSLSVRRLEEDETAQPAALVIETSERQPALRIAQTENLFFLQPGGSYELRATLRLPVLRLGPKGRVRIFVTDARWTWSSPPLELKTPDAAWHTLSVPFSVANEQATGAFRIRIEIIDAELAAEIAEIAVME